MACLFLNIESLLSAAAGDTARHSTLPTPWTADAPRPTIGYPDMLASDRCTVITHIG